MLVDEEGDLSLVVDDHADDGATAVRLRYFSLYTDDATVRFPTRFPGRMN